MATVTDSLYELLHGFRHTEVTGWGIPRKSLALEISCGGFLASHISDETGAIRKHWRPNSGEGASSEVCISWLNFIWRRFKVIHTFLLNCFKM